MAELPSSGIPPSSSESALVTVPGRQKRVSATPNGEYAAAYAIIELAAADVLHRIRQCKRDTACGTWFFAEREHGDFCSDRCRVIYNQTKPENLAIKAARANIAYHKKKADAYRKDGNRVKAKKHSEQLIEAHSRLATLQSGT